MENEKHETTVGTVAAPDSLKADRKAAIRNAYKARNHAKHLQVVGIWSPIPIPGIGTVEVLIKAKDTVNYQEVVQQCYKPIRTQYPEGKVIPPEIQYQLTLEIVAKGIFSDWRGMPDDNGDPLPFTYTNVVKSLENFPELRDISVAVSGEYALYLAAAEREILGN